MSATTDDELVAALGRGEEWAADVLYDRVHRQVDRTLRRLLRYQLSELDDLVQITFERMLRFLAQRSLAPDSQLGAWASAVAANVALDFLRKRSSERRLMASVMLDVEAVVGHEAAPDRHAEARLSVVRLQLLLSELSPKAAEALVLHDILGHDLAEISELTQSSVAATQSRLVRGRKELLRRAQKQSK